MKIIMTPESQSHAGVAEIIISNNKVRACYELDKDFRAIVKEKGFRWNGSVWVKHCSEYTGSPTDRAAELTNALLLNGFRVMCDESIKVKAENADFEPECKRWLKYNKEYDLFILRWGWDDELYEQSKKIHGARYNRELGAVTVEVRNWAEVEDFARIHQFKISSSAQSIIDNYKNNVVYCNVIKPKKPEVLDQLQEILKTPSEILPDLQDDD